MEVGKEPLSSFQIFALIALACLNMQDGFDILAISYAANAITESWDISRSSLGIVFSAGLLGMMIGAMGLSPLADKFGRKAIAIAGLLASGVGMIIATAAPSIMILVLGRIVTGLGVGAILASLNTLVAEYAGQKYRGVAVAIFQLGFPMGAFLSGFIAAWLLDIGSWRHVFAFGAMTSFLFIPVVMVLPESMSYLAKSGRSDALERINKIRAKLGQDKLTSLPQGDNPPVRKPQSSFGATISQLLSRQYQMRTILIWLAFFLLLTTLYFLLTWTPKILIDMGFTEAEGNRGGRSINLIGMAGIVIVGIFSLRIKPSLVTSVYLLALGIVLFVLGMSPLSLGPTLLLIGIIGFFIHGSMIGLYSTVPDLYPVNIRTTGTGWAIGISRFGAVLGPALAGFLFDAGFTPQSLFQFFSVPILIASIIAFLLWREQKQHADQTLDYV